MAPLRRSCRGKVLHAPRLLRLIDCQSERHGPRRGDEPLRPFPCSSVWTDPLHSLPLLPERRFAGLLAVPLQCLPQGADECAHHDHRRAGGVHHRLSPQAVEHQHVQQERDVHHVHHRHLARIRLRHTRGGTLSHPHGHDGVSLHEEGHS